MKREQSCVEGFWWGFLSVKCVTRTTIFPPLLLQENLWTRTGQIQMKISVRHPSNSASFSGLRLRLRLQTFSNKFKSLFWNYRASTLISVIREQILFLRYFRKQSVRWWKGGPRTFFLDEISHMTFGSLRILQGELADIANSSQCLSCSAHVELSWTCYWHNHEKIYGLIWNPILVR